MLADFAMDFPTRLKLPLLAAKSIKRSTIKEYMTRRSDNTVAEKYDKEKNALVETFLYI